MSARETLLTRRAALCALAALSIIPAVPGNAASRALALRERQAGTAVVITYRSTVAGRPRLRGEVLKTLVPRLETWRRNGKLSGYQVLFNSFVTPDSWDLLAILDFRDFDAIKEWRNIERSFPGGLTARELQVLSPGAEYLMDVVGRSQAVATGNGPGVFLVVPYVFSPTPLERYLQYAHGYILPETEGWMRTGNVSGYGLYVNRFYPQEPVQSLLVIEYKDFDALAHREAIVARTREKLSADPAWRTWSEAKGRDNIRTEGRAVIAEQLAAH